MTDSPEILGRLLLADFANVDASGKSNLLGAGIRFLGTNPDSGMSAPFAVFAALESPRPTGSVSPAVEILLADASGSVVEFPGADGSAQKMRVSQVVSFLEPIIQGVQVPKNAVPSTAAFVLNFPSGLPLVSGLTYQWRLQIDHDVIASYSFFVLPTPAQPVFG